MLDAVLACQADHIRLNQALFPAPSVQKASTRELLQKYVAVNKNGFVNLDKQPRLGSKHNPEKCLGFLETKSGQAWVLLTNNVFEKVVGGQDEGLALKTDLVAKGALKLAKAGTDQKHRYVVKRPVGPKGARYSVVKIRLSEFG